MKTAVISGGAGGLGRACADNLLMNGYRVYSLDISVGVEADNLTQLKCDMRSYEQIQSCFERVKSEAGKVDLIVSFAGIYRMALFSELDEAEYMNLININLLGAYRLNKCFLPLLERGKSRVIIVTSELAAFDALPFTGLYAVSKRALDSYADSLRFELALLDIKVIAVRPGAFATSLTGQVENEIDRICSSTVLFKSNADRFRKIVQSQIGGAKNPSVLAKVIYKAANTRRPRPVYTVNASAGLKVLSALPKSLQVWLIRQILLK